VSAIVSINAIVVMFIIMHSFERWHLVDYLFNVKNFSVNIRQLLIFKFTFGLVIGIST